MLVVLTCHRIYGELTYLILNPDRRSVMPSVRPEIEAFVSAAHELLAFDKLGIALTDEEEAALTDCLRRLDEHLFEAPFIWRLRLPTSLSTMTARVFLSSPRRRFLS